MPPRPRSPPASLRQGRSPRLFWTHARQKIRLHAAGRLPAEYVANLGDAQPAVFDTRCCRFLGVNSTPTSLPAPCKAAAMREILAWAHARGTPRTDEDCENLERLHDKNAAGAAPARPRLPPAHRRIQLSETKPIQTFFGFIDFDEDRDPVTARVGELNRSSCSSWDVRQR